MHGTSAYLALTKILRLVSAALRRRVFMAALPRSFGPDVSDTIMRFAVGYPRDRLRDIMNNVTRTEKGGCLDASTAADYHHMDLVVRWKWPASLRRPRCMRMTFIMWVDGPTYAHLQTLKIAHLQWPQKLKVDGLGFTCDACEPVELQLQRTHF